jgi:hypothetical protein
MQAVAVRLRDAICHLVPAEVLDRKFGDKYMLMVRCNDFTAACELADQIERRGEDRYLKPNLVTRLLDGALLFDRATTASMQTLDPSAFSFLQPVYSN